MEKQMKTKPKILKHRAQYRGSFDLEKSLKNFKKEGIRYVIHPTRGNRGTPIEYHGVRGMFFDEKGGKDEGGNISVYLSQDISVLMMRHEYIQISWTNDEKKAFWLNYLESILVDKKRKLGVKLEPEFQTIDNIKHGSEPQILTVPWCEEKIIYQSEGQKQLIQHELDLILHDLHNKLDPDSAMERCIRLYQALQSPEWKEKLKKELFTDIERTASGSNLEKSHWVSFFYNELQKLRFDSSSGKVFLRRKREDFSA
jgi:hypothetical protein